MPACSSAAASTTTVSRQVPDPPVQHLRGRADLLPDVGPAGRRLAVADPAGAARPRRRPDDLRRPARARPGSPGATRSRCARCRSRPPRRAARPTAGSLRHHERGEHLQRQPGGTAQPLPRREHPDVGRRGRQHLLVEPHVAVTRAGALLLDLEHLPGRASSRTSATTVRSPATRSTTCVQVADSTPSASTTASSSTTPSASRSAVTTSSSTTGMRLCAIAYDTTGRQVRVIVVGPAVVGPAVRGG